MNLFLNINKRAFTLIEILVIVFIIGILSSIGMYAYKEAKQRTVRNMCIYNQRILFTAVTQYDIDGVTPRLNELPTDVARLNALYDNGYLRDGGIRDCPEDRDGSYDDYSIIFENGIIKDIDCKINNTHIWP